MRELPEDFAVGMDAREAFRHNPRGIGLYARHLMREFGELCPSLRIKLYHEREIPTDLPPVPAAMTPVQATIPGGRYHAWERVLMPWRIRKDKLSVYHGTYNTLPPEWPLWKGPPMIVALHDVIVTWLDDDLEDPYVQYCRKVTQRTLRDAAAVLTVSEWSRQDIIERFDVEPSKIRVFYNGVHPDFLAGAPDGAADSARARYADNRPYVFSIGSALERKNTGRMLEAIGLVNKRQPIEYEILISGIGEAQRGPFIEIAGRAGIADRVRFLPYLDRKDLIAIYAGADLAIYPSLAEGWGIPVVEALSVGTPIVTSNTTAMPEAGGEHASYFDPHDLESMTDAIQSAYDRHESFAEIRSAAVERARTFTWRRAAEVTLDTYLEVSR